MTTTPGYKPDTRFFGHPWPLVNLFGVEMWERFVFLLRSNRVDDAERNGVKAFIPLFLSQVAFWALFQQMFTFVAVYADERLDRSVGG